MSRGEKQRLNERDRQAQGAQEQEDWTARQNTCKQAREEFKQDLYEDMWQNALLNCDGKMNVNAHAWVLKQEDVAKCNTRMRLARQANFTEDTLEEAKQYCLGRGFVNAEAEIAAQEAKVAEAAQAKQECNTAIEKYQAHMRDIAKPVRDSSGAVSQLLTQMRDESNTMKIAMEVACVSPGKLKGILAAGARQEQERDRRKEAERLASQNACKQVMDKFKREPFEVNYDAAYKACPFDVYLTEKNHGRALCNSRVQEARKAKYAGETLENAK